MAYGSSGMKGKEYEGHSHRGTDTHGVEATGDAPWSGRKDFKRTATNKGTISPGITRPGPVISHPVKRGKRISKNRTANDAAMALKKNMVKTLKEYE